MDAIEAGRIVAAVIAGRIRWGTAYGTGEFSVSEITEALVRQYEAGEIIGQEAAQELLKVKRQLTASQAREAKLKKEIERLKASTGG